MICLLLPYLYRFFDCSSLYQRIEKCSSQLPTVFFAPMAEDDLAYFARSCESQAVLAVEKVHIKGIKTYPPCHHRYFYEISFFVTRHPLHGNWLTSSLQKVSSPKNPFDYRPTSILSAPSKCLERMVHQQM